MNTDRHQIARLGLDKNRQKLNAFVEQISPNTAHTHDDDAFVIPTGCHDIVLHLWATVDYVAVRGKMSGAPIMPTYPPHFKPDLMARCAEVIVDGLCQVHTPLMEKIPAWAVRAVDRELIRRSEGFASLAGVSKTLALGDAIAVVEEELVKRGPVYPERALPALMEAGLSCRWVKDRPCGQQAYAGCSPDLRALQDAIHRAGATPYIRLDPGGYGEDDPPASLHLGWEVVRSESRPIINALHGFVINPGPHTFDVLIGYLRGSRMEILGDGPVAAWARAHCLQK